MDMTERLGNLMEGIQLREEPDWKSQYPRIEFGRYNLSQFAKLDEGRRQRILNMTFTLIANKLHLEALCKYGNTDDLTIRQILDYWFAEMSGDPELEGLRQEATDVLVAEGLTEVDADKISSYLLERLPDAFTEIIVHGVSQWQLFPRTTASETADVLLSMLKEGGNADN